MENIRNVVFDLGGVLVDLDIDRCKAAFRSLGMEAVAQLIDPCYPAEMIGRLEHGEISFHEACEEMRRLAGRPTFRTSGSPGPTESFSRVYRPRNCGPSNACATAG